MDEPRQSETPLGDVIDGAARRIATAFILGGAAIALAIYSRADPPRFEAFETETGIVRVDTRGGTVLHCVENGCYRVVSRGQDLLDGEEREKARTKAFGDEAPPAQRAVQPPQPQKALPAPTAPDPAPANAQ
jgi:hypothetical protein